MGAAQAIGIISLLTLANKLAGFIREMIIAQSYGASFVTDAFRVAQGAPTLFFTCIGTALATALVPLFTQHISHGGKSEAFDFLRKLTSLILVITGALAIFGFLGSGWIVRLMAPGFRGETYALSVRLTRVLFPGLLFTALAFVTAGALQSMGQFSVPALMALPSSLLIIIGVPLLSKQYGIWVLAWAVFFGMMAQFLVQWPALRHCGYRYWWRFDLRDPSIRQMGALIAPVVLGTAILQINTLVDRMFASNLPVGSISVLDYSNRLTGLVIGIVITAVATVSLPKFSQLAASNERDKLTGKVGQAIGSLNALIIPMAVGLMVLRVPIVRFVYERDCHNSGGENCPPERSEDCRETNAAHLVA